MSDFDDPYDPQDPHETDDFDGSTSSASSPICGWCGVSALPPEPHLGTSSMCENPDCAAFGEPI